MILALSATAALLAAVSDSSTPNVLPPVKVERLYFLDCVEEKLEHPREGYSTWEGAKWRRYSKNSATPLGIGYSLDRDDVLRLMAIMGRAQTRREAGGHPLMDVYDAPWLRYELLYPGHNPERHDEYSPFSVLARKFYRAYAEAMDQWERSQSRGIDIPADWTDAIGALRDMSAAVGKLIDVRHDQAEFKRRFGLMLMLGEMEEFLEQHRLKGQNPLFTERWFEDSREWIRGSAEDFDFEEDATVEVADTHKPFELRVVVTMRGWTAERKPRYIDHFTRHYTTTLFTWPMLQMMLQVLK